MRQVPMRPAAVRALDLVLAYGPKVALAESSFEIPRWDNGADRPQRIRQVDPPRCDSRAHRSCGRLYRCAPRDGSAQRISYVLQSTKVNDTLPVTVRRW